MDFYTDVRTTWSHMLVRGYKDGIRFQKKVPYKPYLFVDSKQPKAEYKTIDGKPVDMLLFNSLKEAREFIKTYSDVEGMPIYGMTNFEYPFINDMFPDEVKFNKKKIRIGIIDIEVGSEDGFPDPKIANQEVTAITLYKDGLYVVFGCHDFIPSSDNIKYIKCHDEHTLLRRFLDIWERFDFDIISGWASDSFDIVYMVNRIRKVLGDDAVNRLSPWGMVKQKEFVNDRGQPDYTYDIAGVASIDYLALYKKHAYIPHENYKLDTVAFDDLGEKKVDYSEYKNLHQFYLENFQKFVEYNIRDVELIVKLDKKHKMFDLVLMLTYDSKINFQDVFGSVRLWDVIIHNALMSDGVVVNPTDRNREREVFTGAFVKHPQVGLHEWVVSWDAKSLYPSLLVQHNISPETYRGQYTKKNINPDTILEKDVLFDEELKAYLKENNLSMTGNGALWDRSKQGVFPRLVTRIIDDRDASKKKMLEALKRFEKSKDPADEDEAGRWKIIQQVRKIQINSLYGCLGNLFFRWFRLEAAEGITTSGQVSIQWVEKRVNEFLSKLLGTGPADFVVAIDTDSVYVRFDKFMPKGLTFADQMVWIDKFSEEQISPICEAAFQEVFELTNGRIPYLKMKREKVSIKGIWTAKKRYALYVGIDEGVVYEKPKLKITGLEVIKTSIPQVARDKLKEAIMIVMTGTEAEFLKFISDFEKEYKSLPFEAIAWPRSVNGLKKYGDEKMVYGYKTPAHTKGALFYNRELKRRNLHAAYEQIKEGEKIKFAYLHMPNPIGSEVLSVPGVLPKEFGLDTYINHPKMFDKSFIEPLTPLADAAGWKITNKHVLEFEEDEEYNEWGI